MTSSPGANFQNIEKEMNIKFAQCVGEIAGWPSGEALVGQDN